MKEQRKKPLNRETLSLYQRISKLNRQIKMILEDIEVQTKPQDVPSLKKADIQGKAQYGDKSGVVMNLMEATNLSKQLKKVVLEDSIKILDSAKNELNIIPLEVRDVVVDITKVINELKSASDVIKQENVNTLEEIRSTFRNFYTLHTNNTKKFKQLRDNINQRREKVNVDRFEEEFDRRVQELREQLKGEFGITPDVDPDKLEIEIAEIQKMETESITKIEFEVKEIIRSLRDIIKDIYDIPEEVIETSQIYLKAMGAIASLTRNAPRISMKPEAMRAIIANEKIDKALREKFGEEYFKITDVKDNVNIAKVRVQELSKYYAEINLKSDQQMKSFEESSESLTEGVFSDIAKKTSDQLKKRFKDFSDFVLGVYDKVKKRTKTTSNVISKETKQITKENEEFRLDIMRLYLDIKEMIEREKLEYIKSVKEKI
jgi:hypothetical protein